MREEGAFDLLPPKIDLAVYLAGINAVVHVGDASLETWHNVLAVNLIGAAMFTKAVIPKMRNAGGGLIVYAGSINSMVSYPGRAIYTASKCGLVGLTGVVAVEEGKHDISAVCLALGHLEGLMKSTPVNPRLLDAVRAATPSGNLVSADDVANLITTLYRTRRSISGHTIPVEPAYTINRWPIQDDDD